MKQFLCIQLVVWFGWLSCIAVAQLEISGAITGSASFPHVGIVSLGNLSVFVTSLLRKRLDLEIGARDFLATIAGPSQFKEEPAGPSKFKEEYADKLETKKNEKEKKRMFTCLRKLADFIPSFLRRPRLDLEKGACDLRTGPCRSPEKNKDEVIARLDQEHIKEASVVMLSNSAGMTNSSIKQFMEYIYNAHEVQSALMKYYILRKCGSAEGHNCNCIVIREVPPNNMPQGSGVLLPTPKCRENECHGCKRDLFQLYDLDVKFSSAVYDAVDFQFTTFSENDPICICIPVTDNKWTNLLVKSLKYKDQGDRGAIVAAADALQKYLGQRGEDRAEEIGDKTVSLIAEEIGDKTVSLIVIRLVEIFVNLLLTVFFKVDGFSSALAARRAVRSHVVDSKGNGLPANVFLTSGLVVVKSDSVCQVLKFRGNRFFLLIVGCVNLLCAIAWAVVLIAFNGGIGKWYAVPSMAPSKPRVAVIIAVICIGIVMDCFELPRRTLNKFWRIKEKENQNTSMILGVIILEIVFAVVVGLGLNKGIGRWVYGALQLLVWVKWGIGSSILSAYSPEYVSTSSKPRRVDNGSLTLKDSPVQWVNEGTLVYSSSFLLNAVMVGVMGDWAGIWSTWK